MIQKQYLKHLCDNHIIAQNTLEENEKRRCKQRLSVNFMIITTCVYNWYNLFWVRLSFSGLGLHPPTTD
jgi:hypothetical protein